MLSRNTRKSKGMDQPSVYSRTCPNWRRMVCSFSFDVSCSTLILGKLVLNIRKLKHRFHLKLIRLNRIREQGLASHSVSNSKVRESIVNVWRSHRILIDTHTAVGLSSALNLKSVGVDEHSV